VKVNFDAAFKAESRLGAWGYIARSDEGDCIVGAAGKLRYIRDPLQAEVEAGLAAVEGAAAMGLNRVVFESDSKNLVSALRDKKHDLSVIGVLLKEMRSLCIVSFQSCKFQFVSRRVKSTISTSTCTRGSLPSPYIKNTILRSLNTAEWLVYGHWCQWHGV
jgi:hypothetical protein